MARVLESKDPRDVADFVLTAADLLQAGELIDTFDLAVSGAGEGTHALSGDQLAVVAWLSGGSAGTKATIEAEIVTDAATPRTFAHTFLVPIRVREVVLATKDPDDTHARYVLDLTAGLEDAEEIASIDDASSGDLAVQASAILAGGKQVELLLGGGAAGSTARVALVVTTDAATPRTFGADLLVPVREQ